MSQIDYDTIAEDPKVSSLIIQFLAIRNLENKEIDDLKRLVAIYFPSLECFRNNKQEILNLLLKNAHVIFSEDFQSILTNANELRGTEIAHLAHNRRIIKSANRIKGRIRFFYNKLKELLYGDMSPESRESSQETESIPIPLQEQTVSILSLERMKEEYENAITERNEMIVSLQEQLHQGFLAQLHLEDIHQDEHQDDELYETPPDVVKPLLYYMYPYIDSCVLDPCAGNRMMSNYLASEGYNMINRDLYTNDVHYDFLVESIPEEVGFIICHPPMVQETRFLKRCFELKKPFAILMSCQSLSTESVGELLYKNGGNIHYLIGNQKFIHQNEEIQMGYFAWIIGNSHDVSNRYFLIGHNWSSNIAIRASSFEQEQEQQTTSLEPEQQTTSLEPEQQTTSLEPEPQTSPEPEKQKNTEDEELICSICWDILRDDNIEFGENCAHPFCTVCWKDYHKSTRHNRACPICRTLLKAKHGRKNKVNN